MANVVEIARSQIGVSETGINQCIYNTEYYTHMNGYNDSRGGNDRPWCVTFVWWCMRHAGVGEATFPDTASTAILVQFYRERNLLHQIKKAGEATVSPYSYTPVAGDIMLIQRPNSGHTGLVVATGTMQSFQTVEGNYGNRVSANTRRYNGGFKLNEAVYIAHPNYGATAAATGYELPTGTTIAGDPSGKELGVGTYDYTAYTVKSGDTVTSIANKYGISPALIRFINNLSSDNLTAGTKLNIPTPHASGSGTPATSNGSITTRHTVSYDVYKPTLQIAFFGEYGKLSAVTTETVADSGVAKDIISVNIERSLSQDCGTFSCNLVYRNDWYNAISSNDLVVIRMQRPPEVMRTVFYGLVDDIRKTVDFSSGRPQRSITISGRGFNKAFVNFSVGIIKSIGIDTGTGFFDGLINMTTLDSYDAIKTVLNAYVGKAINYRFGNNKTFSDYFQYTGNHREGEHLIDFTQFTTYSGTLWNFIKELSNAPWCETFWECVNEKPTLFHRRTPFNPSDWNNLPITLIPDSHLVSDNTGRSDLETYTVFSTQQDFMGDDFTNLIRPLWYPPHYSKYGITQLNTGTIYDSFLTTNNVTAVQRQYTIDLFNWNIKNALMANGTLTVKGSNQYTIGSRVVLESNGMEFYVEQVTHSFNCYQSWVTQLGVTRGLLPLSRFTSPWGEYAEMTDREMSAIVMQSSNSTIDWANLPEVKKKETAETNTSGNSTGTSVSRTNVPATTGTSRPSGGTGGTGNPETDGTASTVKKKLILPYGSGDVYTYMGWQMITAKSSLQYKLREEAGMNFDDDGIGIINGRFVIAMSESKVKIGDYVTVYLSNGQKFYGIVGDLKRNSDPGANEWGHESNRFGGARSVTEFVVDKNSWYNKGKTVLRCHPEWKNTTCYQIEITGNYWG